MQRQTIRLRDVTERDCDLLYEWANDPVVRSSSLSPDHISLESHRAWFRKKLADPDCRIFIGEDNEGNPLGQVRFDREDRGAAEIDVHIAPETRGKGVGTALLDAAVERWFRETDAAEVHALVKPENEASRRSFCKAGFTEDGTVERRGQTLLTFVRTRSS